MWLGGKYTPLAQTAAVTAALIGVGMLIIMPVLLIFNGATFATWLFAYEKSLFIVFVLGTIANFIVWLLCELSSFNLPRLLAAGIFSVLSPLMFLVLLGIATFFEKGVFLEGVTSPEGLKNIGLIFGLLFPLCFYIYLGATKSA